MNAASQATPIRRVIASAPDWHLSGVNVFMTRLFRELNARGWDTTVVITNPTAAASERAPVPEDMDIVRLPPTPNRAIRLRQRMLLDELAARAPCVYLPNYDFDTAGVIPALPAGVTVAGIVHSDEGIYYDFVRDLGAWMDGVVAVSTAIEHELEACSPDLAGRLTRIGYGVPVRATAPAKPPAPPLRVVYAGRISHGQKRIGDLAEIVAAIHESEAPVEFDIAGDGPDRQEFERIAAASIAAGSTRMHGSLTPEATASLIDAAHVLVLTSEFEGLPVVLMEAMEAGCVPIVTRIRSGIGELVKDGVNGLMFEVGDIGSACASILRLASEPGLAGAMAGRARARLASSEFALDRSADRYEALFDSLMAARLEPGFKHTPGRAFIPIHHRLGARIATRWAQLTGGRR